MTNNQKSHAAVAGISAAVGALLGIGLYVGIKRAHIEYRCWKREKEHEKEIKQVHSGPVYNILEDGTGKRGELLQAGDTFQIWCPDCGDDETIISLNSERTMTFVSTTLLERISDYGGRFFEDRNPAKSSTLMEELRKLTCGREYSEDNSDIDDDIDI